MSTFRVLLSSAQDSHFQEMIRESAVSPMVESAVAIQVLLCRYPDAFVTDDAMAFLTGKTTRERVLCGFITLSSLLNLFFSLNRNVGSDVPCP